MKQLPQDIMAKGQARRCQDAFGLEKAADASQHCCKAQEKTLGRPRERAGNGLDAGSNLHHAQQNGLNGGREKGNLADKPCQNGEQHNISSDFYHDFQGIHHGLVKRQMGLCFWRPDSGRRLHRVYCLGEKSQGDYGQIDGSQQHGDGNGRVHQRGHIAQKKHGAWMVADGQKVSSLLRGYFFLGCELTAGFCSHGIAAEKAGYQYIASGVRQTEDFSQDGAQRGGHKADSVKGYDNIGADHKGKQGGQHGLIPQKEAVSRPFQGKGRVSQQKE